MFGDTNVVIRIPIWPIMHAYIRCIEFTSVSTTFFIRFLLLSIYICSINLFWNWTFSKLFMLRRIMYYHSIKPLKPYQKGKTTWNIWCAIQGMENCCLEINSSKNKYNCVRFKVNVIQEHQQLYCIFWRSLILFSL